MGMTMSVMLTLRASAITEKVKTLYA
jgi:hypothetical protein